MRVIYILFAVITFTQGLNAQSISNTLFPSQSDSLINTWLAENSIPALGIGIISDFQITQVKVYGELEKGKPAPYNTIFKVASLTKPIVSMVTMKLISEGKLGLDDKLYTYWIDPDVSDNSLHKSLTIEHVLTHQTGFKNWRRLHENGKLDFDFTPGIRFQYSGEGFEYLRKYLEKRFDTTIEELASSLLFKPLGMDDTQFSWAEPFDTSRYALNHDANGQQIPTHKNMEANGANLLLSTVEDYSKFAVHVLKGAGLSKELYKDMITKQVAVNQYSDFGLGWEIVPDFVDGKNVIMHSGGDPGVSTLVVLEPVSGKGIIVFSNSDNGGWKYWNDLIMSSFQ